MIRANDVFRRRCFSSSSGEPPSSGNETQKESRRQNNNNNNNNRYSHSHSHNNHPKETKTTQQQQRWPKQKQKHRNQRDEWKPKRNNEHRRRKQDRFPSLVQSSQYAYAVRSINAASSASPSDPNSNPNSRSARGNTKPTTAANNNNNNNNTSNADANAVRTLRSVNAAALLDPLAYCKGSTKLSAHAKVGGKSISGTDAARRLLKGKREVLEAARELGTAPVLLEGHGVPPALFQHCVDLGAALLEHYGPETVECSFHNYEQEQEHDAQTHTHSHPTTNRPNTDRTRKTPLHVRVRRRDGTNACLPPPLASEIDPTDWDYNLALYLTVMERLAKCLGPVLESFPSRDDASPDTGNAFASFRHSRNGNGNDVAHHHDGVPPVSSQPQPRWNVDVLEGAYFDFRPIGESSNRIPNENKNTKVTANESDNRAARGRKSDGFRPFPVVEFLPQHGSRSSGHVLIRLQGFPRPNREFGSGEGPRGLQRTPPQTVTLVFDACFEASNNC